MVSKWVVRAGLVKGHLGIEEWNPENVVKFILACRRQEGIPTFTTRFAGARFKFDSTNAVLAKCWGGKKEEISTYFYKVPEEDLKLIEESVGDWRKLLDKYGTEAQKSEAERYGIYLKGFKLPRIIVK